MGNKRYGAYQCLLSKRILRTKKLDLELEKAIETGNPFKAKKLKAELEQQLNTFTEEL